MEDRAGSRIGLPPSRPPPAPLDPASAAAAGMIERAQGQAKAILDQAEKEALAAVEDATARGEEEGRQSAQEMEGLAERLEQQLTGGLEREALEAAVGACRELLELEMKHRPRTVVDMVAKALASARHQRDIYVRANPRDAAILREHKRQLLDVLSRARDIDIRDDAVLAPGGCLIETEVGTIDARVEIQLETLARRLLGRG